jgi:hypothetical protein
MDKQELGAFLRSRRERLRPEDVGIPSGPRRRTPGLRSAPGTSGKITALACRSAYAPANCPAADSRPNGASSRRPAASHDVRYGTKPGPASCAGSLLIISV